MAVRGYGPISSTGGSEQGQPYAGEILSDNTLYGTVLGVNGNGEVFALGLGPPWAIASAGRQVVLSWPTWAPHFGLQTTSNLSSGSWSNLTGQITTVWTNNIFTNGISSGQQFFRLEPQ